MRVSVAQFAASCIWGANAAACGGFMTQAERTGSDLLVLPEAVLAAVPWDHARTIALAQPLNGPFVTDLRRRSAGSPVTVVVGIYERGPDNRVSNTVVAIRDEEIVAIYRKLHLYDAFDNRESDLVCPGDELPPVFEVSGWQVGLMTCYDVRFPEVARTLVDRGAEVLALPAAWARGPLKERHWELMVAARALENVCFVAASDECGPTNVGSSMIVDPLGVVRTRLAAEAGQATLELTRHALVSAREMLPVLADRRLKVDPTVS